jgi:hypothetical protein
MSTEERSVWFTLLATPLAAGVYLAVIVSRAWSTSVEDVSWAVPMIWASGAMIAAQVILAIAAAVTTEVSAEVRAAMHDAVADKHGGRPSPEARAGVAAVEGRSKTTRRTVESDERDKLIGRLGDYRAGHVIAGGALVAIVLTMLELDHFWIAHALFGALVLGGIYGAAAKAVAYRRGVSPWSGLRRSPTRSVV